MNLEKPVLESCAFSCMIKFELGSLVQKLLIMFVYLSWLYWNILELRACDLITICLSCVLNLYIHFPHYQSKSPMLYDVYTTPGSTGIF